MERYKLIYQNGLLTKVIEVTDQNGIVRSTPITYTSSSPGWGSLLSGITTCTDTNIEVVQSCLFDNTTGDYLNLVPFVRYSTLNTINGTLTYLGDYQFVSSGVIPYTVIGTPVLQAGSDVVGSKCFRDVLTSGESWVLGSYPKTYTLDINAISGTPSITDANGSTNMFTGEHVKYEASSDGAGLLTGQLTISAGAGDAVVISWTELSL